MYNADSDLARAEAAADPPKRTVSKAASTAFRRSDDDEYAAKCRHSVSGRIFFNLVWIVVTVLMCIYTKQIVSQYIIGSQHPSNTVTVETKDSLPLPQVVVCNWNSDNSTNSNSSCPFCRLEIVGCSFINTSTDCSSQWAPTFVKTNEGGSFNCYTFNDDPKAIRWSQTVAYAGAYATVFKLKLPPLNVIGPQSPRAGVQVTFGVQGAITPSDIYKEIHFSSVGFDTFYAITTITTLHEELDLTDQNYNATRYTTTSSAVQLLNSFVVNPDNSTDGYLGVSFAFETLNLEIVRYGYTYTIVNLLGDFAGMIGSLMGLDTIKIMVAIPLMWASYKMRSCVPLEDHFNG